jgi:ADP-heptose:LPS heptosyltransferase
MGLFWALTADYDKSAYNFSRAQRFRYFFLNIEKKYKHALMQSSRKYSLLIRGGIGDLLQHLPFVLENKDFNYVVLTHFRGADVFFKKLFIRNIEFHFFKRHSEFLQLNNLLNKDNNLIICPRNLFFESDPFGKKGNNFKKDNNNLIIGVHFSSSAIDNSKSLPIEFIYKLVNQLKEDNKILFFGTKQELNLINLARLNKTKKIEFVCDENISNCFSKVSGCDILLGCDSSFKTMSSMLKIPTIVYLTSRSRNSFRDRMFIDPYVKENIMCKYKFVNFSENQINKAVNFTLNKLITFQFISNKSLA